MTPSAKEMGEACIFAAGLACGPHVEWLEEAAAHIEASEALRERLRGMVNTWREGRREEGAMKLPHMYEAVLATLETCADELEAILEGKA